MLTCFYSSVPRDQRRERRGRRGGVPGGHAQARRAEPQNAAGHPRGHVDVGTEHARHRRDGELLRRREPEGELPRGQGSEELALLPQLLARRHR